jgi:hypothetical protein
MLHEQVAMRVQVVLIGLAIIALGATAISLALQNYFGSSTVLILLGHVLAAAGAAALALWLAHRRDG